MRMERSKWKTYAFWLLVTEGIGALSGFLTREGSKLYTATVTKPPLSPPPWVFPVVWGILFALMAVGAARVDLSSPSEERSAALRLYLTSQSHHEKPPEVTCTSRGKPGFPASTRERPRETFFNTSPGQVPLPGLESNDALPVASRMETRLPWANTRGILNSPS